MGTSPSAAHPLDLTNGTTLDGYTGSITVTAGGGNNTDSVTLNGNAANVLTVSATPTTLTTDQNTPVTFQANVNTSLADTYTITAQAPAGWTVTIDSSGNVTATPAPGLQGGTYPIQIIAQSSDRSEPGRTNHRRRDHHADAAGHDARRQPGPDVHRALRRCSGSHGLPRRHPQHRPRRRYVQPELRQRPQRLHSRQQRDQRHGAGGADGDRRQFT